MHQNVNMSMALENSCLPHKGNDKVSVHQNGLTGRFVSSMVIPHG